ncbi:peptidoglycan-binding protein, partial [Streptomyces zhihengii]
GFEMDAMRNRIASRLGATPTPVDPPAKPTTYTVKDGDTLSAIGKRLSIPWQDIATTNKISAPYRIQPGQVLKLPGKTASRPPTPPAQPRYEPFPGAAFFADGRRSAIVTAMGRRLVAEGCGRYQVGPGPSWSEADRKSYAAWQRKLGYTGSAADGIPGKTSWDRLQVPNI